MATSVKSIIESFCLLHSTLKEDNFGKTFKFKNWSEQELAPLVRVYLLGYFGTKVRPEVKTALPGAKTKIGYLDYVIDNVAVELAVRRKADGNAPLSKRVNKNEVWKLLKYNGSSLLVLLDFSDKPLDEDHLQGFRNWESLGKGKHKISPFTVAYIFIDKSSKNGIGLIQLNVGVKRSKGGLQKLTTRVKKHKD